MNAVLLAVSGVFLIDPVVLERPEFPETPRYSNMEAAFDIHPVECTECGVTSYATWFSSLGEPWPAETFHRGGINDETRGHTPPEIIPAVVRTNSGEYFHLFQIISSNDHSMAMYGSPPNRFGVILDPRILLILDRASLSVRASFDFGEFAWPPDETGNNPFTFQALTWAELDRGVLYVSSAHRTYASSSGGRNGYMTAVDPASADVLWRSGPLVSNSGNFVLLEDVIITGYGFTGEEDHIHVLDRNTGEVILSERLPSAPEYLYASGGLIRIRCYGYCCLYEYTR